MIIYFSKKDCGKCEYVKKHVNLEELGVKELDVMTIDGRAELAFHELVGVSETSLPILVLDDGSHITGSINIKTYLLNLKKERV